MTTNTYSRFKMYFKVCQKLKVNLFLIVPHLNAEMAKGTRTKTEIDKGFPSSFYCKDLTNEELQICTLLFNPSA